MPTLNAVLKPWCLQVRLSRAERCSYESIKTFFHFTLDNLIWRPKIPLQRYVQHMVSRYRRNYGIFLHLRTSQKVVTEMLRKIRAFKSGSSFRWRYRRINLLADFLPTRCNFYSKHEFQLIKTILQCETASKSSLRKYKPFILDGGFFDCSYQILT
jgi:hypothetical protein